MSADRELLEMAAKAAGMEHMRWSGPMGLCRMLDPTRPDTTGSIGAFWNPLTDDGDALRLATKLHLYVKHFPFLEDDTDKYPGFLEVCRVDDSDPLFVDYLTNESGRLDATRRAIVRAAAEIGRLQ